MVHVYDADGSTVIEDLRSSRRARFADLTGIEDQITRWLEGAEAEQNPQSDSPPATP